tara:strand:- start:799 stop:1581 length:783 start_codon:yes stop_codon:yes gene_type:complete
MNLSEIGKVYKLNSENKFIIDKDKEFPQPLINLVNVVLKYIKSIVNLHSIYLRGSCLELDVTDKSISDLDISIVYESDAFRYNTMNNESKETIIETMNELYGFSLRPDVGFYSKPLWLYNPINRFYARRIAGNEDLSITSLDIDEALSFQKGVEDQQFVSCVNKIRNCRNDSMYIKNIIKQFYRTFGMIVLLNKKMLSRDIYYCHTALVENYPEKSQSLEKILHLFLNTEDYTYSKILSILDEFEETTTYLHSVVNSTHK